jgi:undecaprenyl-diphosphatase
VSAGAAPTSFDAAIQSWMLAHQAPLAEQIFRWITTLGGITGMRVLAVVGAAYLLYRGRRGVAAGVLAAPVLADILFHVLKPLYARPRPLGLGGLVDSSYSFPSGHATMSAGVCCTLAYVLWRERLMRRQFALTLAVLVPLLVGVSRVYLNVHWATDVLGGWCAGLFLAVLFAVPYNRYRRRHAVDREAPEPGVVPATRSAHE